MKWPFKFGISLKIFLGYFILVGLAAWFVLTVIINEVKPGVRQAMEDSLVDTANILAELATNDFKAGNINHGEFAKSLAQYQARGGEATIWGVNKLSADYRIYIANTKGIIQFDSAGLALGQDYSKWNDVYLTLRGKYGARSSPLIANQVEGETVMYVAAPIKNGATIIGALTVAKANRTMLPFIERAEQKIIKLGALLFVLSILIGSLFTWRLTRKINILRDYAAKVAVGEKAVAPTSSNDELAELATAMQTMRQELDGKQYIQSSVQHLTHELKSPITAIQGNLELFSLQMPVATQTQFLTQIKTQINRVQTIIQNMLGLAELEHQQQLTLKTTVHLRELIQTQVELLADKANSKQIQLHISAPANVVIQGDAFLLGQAIYNVLENALDFCGEHGQIIIQLTRQTHTTVLSIEDNGAGIPDYALSKIFDKFYSLPRPNSNTKSTGLGLNFVREIMKLHGGEITVHNVQPTGVRVALTLPTTK
jgi:two-component system, OmpR family, sensor histidine kinase CreC